MPSWRRVFTSEEARIEALAGQTPPNCADPHAVQARVQGEACPACGRVHLAYTRSDWPFPRVDAAGDEDDPEPPDEGRAEPGGQT